ncbi:hypothetical protein AX15_004725 [Amanita polypyramis BW_CC]|nr:hypothetical protein AX15_004725 [Amanita polypyramis BW_CC]
MSLCKDCYRGVTHQGTPTGTIEKIGGIESYIATPTVNYAKTKVVLFLSDIFGLKLPNSQLLCDDFARNGFKTIMPDYLFGDAIPLEAMATGRVSLEEWRSRHTQAVTRPILDDVIKALKEQGIEHFAAVGYCFGARYVFDLAFDHVIDVGVIAHPTLLKVPEDFQKYATIAKAPLLINGSTHDFMFPLESQIVADKFLGNFAPGYRRECFEGCGHGFAIRGDITVPKIRAGKEGAFKATVGWFQKYF